RSTSYRGERGVHTTPRSPSFLSTVHTEAQIAAVVDAYVEAGREMARGGFFEGAHAEVSGQAPPVASPAGGSNGMGTTGATGAIGSNGKHGLNGMNGTNGTKP